MLCPIEPKSWRDGCWTRRSIPTTNNKQHEYQQQHYGDERCEPSANSVHVHQEDIGTSGWPGPKQDGPIVQLFNPNNCRIILNATPFAQAAIFLQMWQTQVVQTQHALTGIDYHVIPGSGTLICNVNCKVRFDESGKDKMGQDATVPVQPINASGNGNGNRLNDMNKASLYGAHISVFLFNWLSTTGFSETTSTAWYRGLTTTWFINPMILCWEFNEGSRPTYEIKKPIYTSKP